MATNSCLYRREDNIREYLPYYFKYHFTTLCLAKAQKLYPETSLNHSSIAFCHRQVEISVRASQYGIFITDVIFIECLISFNVSSSRVIFKDYAMYTCNHLISPILQATHILLKKTLLCEMTINSICKCFVLFSTRICV